MPAPAAAARPGRRRELEPVPGGRSGVAAGRVERDNPPARSSTMSKSTPPTRPRRARLAGVVALLLLGASCRAPGSAPPVWREPATGMAFVLVPAGRFAMGSPADEPGREAQETRHPVVLTRPYWLGRTEVTQAQCRTVLGADPSHFAALADELPVERVSLHDVERFLAELERRSPGSRFRLPTEAEWEHACRAGRATAYPTGARLTTAEANYDGRYPLPGQPPGENRDRPTKVASFPPNPWGLHDMNGNVWEWTADEHCPYPEGEAVDPLGRCGAALRIIRGGSWAFGADSARCALRYTHAPQDRGYSLGFRVVREASAPGARDNAPAGGHAAP